MRIVRRIIKSLLVVVAITLGCYLGWIALRSQDRFCTTDDTVYQSIESQHETWLRQFSDQSPVVGFTTTDGEPHIAYRAWGNMPDMFIVQIEPARQEPYGARGYIYTPNIPTNGEPLDHRYHTQHLEGNIFCYRFKTEQELHESDSW